MKTNFDEELAELAAQEANSQDKDPAGSSPENEAEVPPSQEGGDDPEKPEEKSGEEDEGNAPDEEKDVPFHENPRWKEIYAERKKLRSDVDKVNQEKDEALKRIEELEKRLAAKPAQEETAQVPEWFQTVFGDDKEAYKQFLAGTVGDQETIIKKVLERVERQTSSQDEEKQKWIDWTNDQVKSLSEVIGLDLHDEKNESTKNEILKTTMEYKPMDDNGYIDIFKGYEIWRELKEAKEASKKTSEKKEDDERKRIAATTTGRSSGAAPEKMLTSKDLKNVSFHDLIS